MSPAGRQVFNPVTGESITFLETAADTNGSASGRRSASRPGAAAWPADRPERRRDRDQLLRSPHDRRLRRRSPETFEQTAATIRSHVTRIRDITGSYDHVAIESDLDGFIKPMLRGLEHSGRMSALQDALCAEYGEETAEKICSANLLRLLQRHWGARPGLTHADQTPAMAAGAA